MHDDERILDPEQEKEAQQGRGQVEVLAEQRREEDAAEAEVRPVEPAARTHYLDVAALTRRVVAGAELRDGELAVLSVDEQRAMALLGKAASGLREDGSTVLAEERLEQLNHALAVLQPTLAMGLAPELDDARAVYDQLVEDVVELRQELEQLAEAQGEASPEAVMEQEGGDVDDDAPEGAGDAADAAEEASGEDRRLGGGGPRRSRGPSYAIAGPVPDPDAGDPPRRSTLSGEPDEPPAPKAATPATASVPAKAR